MGVKEILVIFVVILLLFGAKKIPQLMRGLGKGVREFSDAKDNKDKEIDDEIVRREETSSKL
jgi:sec-independent protein translocase protein TatA